MGTKDVAHTGSQTRHSTALGPAFFRRVDAALATKNAERTWSLIDAAAVSEPALLARALVARQRLAFVVKATISTTSRQPAKSVEIRALEGGAQ